MPDPTAPIADTTQAPAPAAPAAAPVAAPVASPASAAPVAAPTPATQATAPTAPAAAPTTAPAAPTAAPAAAAPTPYTLTVPEGANIDTTVAGLYTETANSLGIGKDAAQAILDKVGPAIAAQNAQALTAFYADIGGMPDTWAATVQADKEIGGDNLTANLAIAAKALDLGGPGLRAMLNKTGLGNHPEVVKWAVKVGKSLSEDTFVSGGSGSAQGATAAERLYG